jgi:hypothetical protein
MVGSLHKTPVAILPFLTPHSAAVAFCEGILRYGTAWEVLMRDELLNSYMTREQVLERLLTVLSLADVTQFPAPEHPKPVIFVAATVTAVVYSGGFCTNCLFSTLHAYHFRFSYFSYPWYTHYCMS